MNSNELDMRDSLSKYDEGDYDVVKELIQLVYHDSLLEYNTSFNTGDTEREGLKFIIADRIFWFMVDNTKWTEDVDLDLIYELVNEYFNK